MPRSIQVSSSSAQRANGCPVRAAAYRRRRRFQRSTAGTSPSTTRAASTISRVGHQAEIDSDEPVLDVALLAALVSPLSADSAADAVAADPPLPDSPEPLLRGAHGSATARVASDPVSGVGSNGTHPTPAK